MHFSDLFFFLLIFILGMKKRGPGGQKGKGGKKMYIVSIKLVRKFLFWGGAERSGGRGFLLCV